LCMAKGFFIAFSGVDGTDIKQVSEGL